MRKQPTSNTKTEEFEITQFILKPMELKKVCLGRYVVNGPIPRFLITWQPHDAPHVVTYHDYPAKQQDGTYILYRQFQNFDGDRSCTIQIQRAHEPNSGQPARLDEL